MKECLSFSLLNPVLYENKNFDLNQQHILISEDINARNSLSLDDGISDENIEIQKKK